MRARRGNRIHGQPNPRTVMNIQVEPDAAAYNFNGVLRFSHGAGHSWMRVVDRVARAGEESVISTRSHRTAHGLEHEPAGLVPTDRRALDDLFSAAYEELRRLASSVRRDDPGATLNPTALVNEAWLKLADAPGFASASRLHLKRIAARAMRQVLIEAARRRHARKRDAGVAVTFDESVGSAPARTDELLALDAALEELAQVNPRQALMVECRFFGGIGVSETAEMLDVSEATLLRDWRAARAWLAVELRRAR